MNPFLYLICITHIYTHILRKLGRIGDGKVVVQLRVDVRPVHVDVVVAVAAQMLVKNAQRVHRLVDDDSHRLERPSEITWKRIPAKS